MPHVEFCTRKLFIALLAIASTLLLFSCGGASDDGSTTIEPLPTNTGLPAPLVVCSQTNPCTRPAPELCVAKITEASFMPVCRTNEPGRTVYDDGVPRHRLEDAMLSHRLKATLRFRSAQINGCLSIALSWNDICDANFSPAKWYIIEMVIGQTIVSAT